MRVALVLVLVAVACASRRRLPRYTDEFDHDSIQDFRDLQLHEMERVDMEFDRDDYLEEDEAHVRTRRTSTAAKKTTARGATTGPAGGNLTVLEVTRLQLAEAIARNRAVEAWRVARDGPPSRYTFQRAARRARMMARAGPLIKTARRIEAIANRTIAALGGRIDLRTPCRGRLMEGCSCVGSQECHLGFFMARENNCTNANQTDVVCWSARAPELAGSGRALRAMGLLREGMHLFVTQLLRRYGPGTRQRSLLDTHYRFGARDRKQPAELFADCLAFVASGGPLRGAVQPSQWLYYVQYVFRVHQYKFHACPANVEGAARELLQLNPPTNFRTWN